MAAECLDSPHCEKQMLVACQVVSELLSQHVLKNYDKFVAGIDEVGLVERDLVSAYDTAKNARANLLASSAEISTSIQVRRNIAQECFILPFPCAKHFCGMFWAINTNRSVATFCALPCKESSRSWAPTAAPIASPVPLD
jgi:hypothetical protein